MKDEKPFGYLDRLSQNIRILDEAILTAQKMPNPKKKGDAPSGQSLKILRDFIELRNATLIEAKAHLLGRDETGAVREPADVYDSNPEVMFERAFNEFLEPWRESDLKLKCTDCGVKSEEVYSRSVKVNDVTERSDLCDNCHEKRWAAPKLLECEKCRVKSEDVSHRKLPGHWTAGILFDGTEYKLCNKCFANMPKRSEDM